MDRWKYHDITHRVHNILNPFKDEKMDQLLDLLPIKDGFSVLDIGTGKAETLIRLAQRYNITAVGVDLSPLFVTTARQRVIDANLEESIKIPEQDGKAYLDSVERNSLDLTICIGASWIFEGFQGTLKAMKSVTRPGGLIISGEPFWRGIPSKKYLDNQDVTYETFSTHEGNVRIGEKLGLRPIFSMTSNDDDWEWYENRKWLGVDMHLEQFPDDPDNEALVTKAKASRNAYLDEGRYVMGWAIYVFRKIP